VQQVKLRQNACGQDFFKLSSMRLTLKAINDEFQRLGHDVQLTKGDGYFYFQGGSSVDWLDTTVRVPTVSSLTLEQWVEEFNRLKKVNQEVLRGSGASDTPKPESSSTRPRAKE
jgi:hypothetical protein